MSLSLSHVGASPHTEAQALLSLSCFLAVMKDFINTNCARIRALSADMQTVHIVPM